MNGTMTVIATIGNVIGVGVSVPYTQEVRRIGWIVSCRMVIRKPAILTLKVPVAIQFIPAIGIFATVPFCPGMSNRYSFMYDLIADAIFRVTEVALDEWPRNSGSGRTG
jgi:hypothetical protein